jgi:diguanylate cyclase (GGDEF)-like protein
VVSVIEASYLLAYYDGLTTLPARRALTEALQRLAGQYTIAMIDIDHFKKFNDEYGHDVGDQVLRMVAARLSKVTGGGRAYRYGGEEFAILFPGKSVDETLAHLEGVRTAVGGSTFTIRRRIRRKRADAKGRRRGTQVSITVSIGVADRNSRHATPEQVVRAADQALYRAKGDGRNRVRS